MKTPQYREFINLGAQPFHQILVVKRIEQHPELAADNRFEVASVKNLSPSSARLRIVNLTTKSDEISGLSKF